MTSRHQLMAVWIAAAVGFGALLAVARAKESPLDDPDPAWQRPGFLDANGLPQPALPLISDLPRPGRPAVVFFVRPDDVEELCRTLSGGRLGARAGVVVVVSGPGGCSVVATVNDPAGHLSTAYGLHRPRSGGLPVGFAVVDGRSRIRYRTLDPTVAEHHGEVDTAVRAIR